MFCGTAVQCLFGSALRIAKPPGLYVGSWVCARHRPLRASPRQLPALLARIRYNVDGGLKYRDFRRLVKSHLTVDQP